MTKLNTNIDLQAYTFSLREPSDTYNDGMYSQIFTYISNEMF